ncbi:MAG: energy transducer TonB [Pseudomonadota bacterium]
MMIRYTLGLLPACVAVFLLFWGLQGMIGVGRVLVIRRDDLHLVDFVRLNKEQVVTPKERKTVSKPKPIKNPAKPKVDVKREIEVVRQPLLPEKIDYTPSLDLSAVSGLGDAMVDGFGGKEISADVLPLARIEPIYPKRAKMMKKEGYVKLEFVITPFGTVRNVKVVDADPPGLFDDSACRAVLRWKFKPKIENDKPIEQLAMIQIDFKLNQ